MLELSESGSERDACCATADNSALLGLLLGSAVTAAGADDVMKGWEAVGAGGGWLDAKP